jgi:AAA family ATP:ADP antiporter
VAADEHSFSDLRAATLAALVVGPLLALQVGSKAVRDALFLSVFGVRALPQVMLAAAGLSLAGAILLSRLMPRYGPRRLLPALPAVGAVLFAAEGSLLSDWPRAVAALAYVQVATLGALSITSFWSWVNERFDPHAARHLVGRVAAGGALGGLMGGIMAERVTAWLGSRALLFVLAALSAGVALGALRLGATPSRSVSARSRLSPVKSTPYLRKMAALVIVVGIISATSDYVLKAEASNAMSSVSDLTRFFAAFYTISSLFTFLVQAGLAQRALQRIGLGGTLVVLPAAMLVSGVLTGVLTRLWTATVLKGTEATLSNSLFRSGYELLYTPVGEEPKRRAKALIDVGADRVGDMAGSGLILLVLAMTANGATSTAVWIVVLSAAVALWLSIGLYGGYVKELAASLQAGTVHLRPNQVTDATTRLTLSQTMAGANRAELLAEIERLWQAGPRSEAVVAARTIDVAGVKPGDVAGLRDFVELCSGDPDRVATTLSRTWLDERLVPLVVRLLGDNRTARSARAALHRFGDRVAGQLGDVLLDSGQPFRVRRRIPALLAELRSGRAACALMEGLSDERFEVRRRCGLALRELLRSQPALHPGPSPIMDAAARELDGGSDRAGDAIERVEKDSIVRVRHVLTLIGIATGSEAIELASRALESSDGRLRGTALEYLDNVLPSPVRVQLLQSLGAPSSKPAVPRSPGELERELNRSAANLPVVVESLPPPSEEED